MSVTRAAADAANQRNAVLAGFLGWTLDAFDFFILTLVIEDLAHAFFPGSPLEDARPRIALAITLTLAMRPIGALVFGLVADRYGRRLPLMLNVLSAGASGLGAIAACVSFDYVPKMLPYFLALAAASFLYVAMADLIPGLHRGRTDASSLRQILLIGAGIASMLVLE